MDKRPFFPNAEEQALLRNWNKTAKEYPLHKCLHELIEEQVAQNPDKPAVRFGDEQFSFAELNRRSNQCAYFLRGLGVGPDSVVGVLMERSLEMVTALLGILKAGGAYLPLDPAYPYERLRFMLEDAGVSIAFTQEKHKKALKEFEGTALCLDSERNWLSREPEDNPERTITPENIAYVIYTSGSTGKPKGCMLPHKAICNRLLWMQDAYQLSDGDRVLQKTPFTFDVSVWEFFWPLLSGACLVIAKPEGHKDANYLVEIIRKEMITTCHFVPSMLRFFMSNANVSSCVSLRQVFTSGEELSFDLLTVFKKKLPAKLHNLYGPTEAAVDVTYWECGERADRKVPIGRPISNIKIYILDEELNQIAIGHEGELYIGGIGLAKGYLNRPDLTAERFVADPFSTESGARLYKTGDKAKYLPDGNIEYLGRLDFQVKLRGNRIELGEIETVLRNHEAIEDAVVRVRDEKSGDPKLVAYVLAQGELPAAKQIREFVKSKLPDYMVPNIIVPLDTLPVTQHGKLDQAALPWPAKGEVPEDKRSAKAKPSEDPRENVSNSLLQHLKKALNVIDLPVEDDLFDLGATSLTMVQLVDEIQKQYGVSLPVEVFLDAPTVKAIVDHVCKKIGSYKDTIQTDDMQSAKERPHDENFTSGKTEGSANTIADALLGYFREVLDIKGLSPEDDLFEIGATSLTMLQIVEQIQKDYDVSVPVEVFLEQPTITAVTDYISRVKSEEKDKRRTSTCRPQMDMTLQENKTDGKNVIELQNVHFRKIAYLQGAIQRNFQKKTLRLYSFSRFLSLLKREIIKGEPKYLYPSAGGLNAIQVYLFIKENAVEGVKKGIYYYHPEEHALYLIDSFPIIERSMFFEYDRSVFDNTGFVLFFIAQLDAITPVYQTASPSLVTLDAGYIGQLLLSRQRDFNLGLCPVEGVDFDRISPFFKLDDSHRFIHCMLGGVDDNFSGEPDRSDPDKGIADYLRRTGRSMTEHFGNDSSDRSVASFLNFGLPVKFEQMHFLNKEEHDQFHAKHAQIRRFSGEKAAITLNRQDFDESEYRLRSSRRDYIQRPVPFDQFSKFLSLLKREHKAGTFRYLYASVSGTYGIEIYLYIKENGVEGLAPGIYRYDREKHQLVLVTAKLTKIIKTSYTPFNRKHYQKSSFCMFLIGKLEVFKPLYKDESLHVALLDTGYMGQLLMDRQAEFEIGICPIGGLNFDRIRGDFKLDDSHVLLQSFTCGSFEQEIPQNRRFLEYGRGETERAAEICNGVPASRRRPALQHDIAVVGISGRYPGARNPDEYWNNLKEGKNSIDKAPESREKLWDHGRGESADRKTLSGRGGFLDRIECFDGLLFNISPSEARTMDPQERLFMEVVWECLENAGYTAVNLMNSSVTVGVFVGAMWNDYQTQGVYAISETPATRTVAIHSSIANRISYFFNFNGPSIAVNTSCSSAMTAIHLACESIKRGECDAAVVGGVNLITHRYHLDALTGLDLLSKNGECRPLSAIATGWLPGEGVGALLIKPLENAERDKDYIHGIIKGTAIGHSGRTIRFGAPNSAIQSESIQRVITDTSISVESINYIDAAAAGASIADASEINAIKKVFQDCGQTSSPRFIGSVKANIGHLESASAISQLTKVLLQMKHGLIAPTINFEPVSPLIKLERSGLEIIDSLKPWPLSNAKNGEGKDEKQLPRRALINAFGATGSGGHIIVEEYIHAENKTRTVSTPKLVPLSAATETQLKEQVSRLYEYLSKAGSSVHLSDIAYTLQTGRIEMEERLAIVADSLDIFIEKLGKFLKGGDQFQDLYRGVARENQPSATDKENMRSIAENWVQGAAIVWSDLHDGSERRIPLPTYPFALVKHWVKEFSDQFEESLDSAGEGAGRPVHLTTCNSQHEAATNALLSKVEGYLKKRFSEVSEIPVTGISTTAPLGKYGINSLMIKTLNARLETNFGELPKTLFFEYQTIQALAGFFLKYYENHLRHMLGVATNMATRPNDSRPAVSDSADAREIGESVPDSVRYHCFASSKREDREEKGAMDIAIIGVSGRYPGSGSIHEFWKKLRDGEDCVTEVPKDRWDHTLYYDEDRSKPGKTCCKWGGFLDRVDRFDPLFFNISPREADIMDPMERLFLETVWNLLESAGYTREIVQERHQARVGVYVGAMFQNYHSFSSDIVTESALAVSSYNTLANRVSYYFNLQGPSIAIDTACSSSAVAIHMACESLLAGNCQLAIAGGVNLSLHPKKYLGLSMAQMLGTRCDSRSFANGDGYIPSEGVGAVLLKPLSQAIRDRDLILAVIKSTTTNHGGYTNGYSVPSPNGQAQLFEDNFIKSRIDPRTISYVEAAANGSDLGDPIEIGALTKAFQKFTPDRQFCAIGSVKSNIGHPEAASGIAQLTKVVLQLQHAQLVPSIKTESLNPNINFSNTPFFLQRELQEWNRPVIRIDGEDREFPRRAAISSLGALGSNAHLIVEEYIPAEKKALQIASAGRPHIVVLSAKNQDRLRTVVQNMLEFIKVQQEFSLSDIAYTLQARRDAMDYRVAMVVSDLQELTRGLEESLSKLENNAFETSIPIFTGELETQPSEIAELLSGKTGEIVVKMFLEENNPEKIAHYWVKGGSIPWGLLHKGQNVCVVPLPTYPFCKDRYWIVPSDKADTRGGLQTTKKEQSAVLHTHRSTESIRDYIALYLGQELNLDRNQIKLNKNIRDYGADSIVIKKLVRDLEERLHVQIPGREMLEHLTIQSLTDYLRSKTDGLGREELAGDLAVETKPLQTDRVACGQNHQPAVIFAMPDSDKTEAPKHAEDNQPVKYGLSEGQSGLWMLQKISPSMSAYNVPICFRIGPRFDIDKFKEACRHVQMQYPILTTVFGEEDGIPYQKIEQMQSLDFRQEYVSTLKPDEILPYIRERKNAPFQLETGPLMRVIHFCRSEQEHIVLITIHHIVFDGSSALAFITALMDAYRNLLQGKKSDLAGLPADYQDFVEWERRMLTDNEQKKHASFWKQQLSGTLPTLELPTDYPRSVSQIVDGQVYTSLISGELFRQLKSFAGSQQMNLAVIFLAVFKVLLHRYSGQEDIIVGMPTMGRPQKRFDPLIGYFINMIPVRSQIGESHSFTQFLLELQYTVVDGLDHAVYPFPAIVRDLKVPRIHGRTPVFQAAFTYQNFLQTADLKHFERRYENAFCLELVEDIHQESEYELELEVFEREDEFVMNMKYDSHLFTKSTIGRMMKHYENIARQITKYPKLKISDIDILTAEEKKQILVDFNNTDAEYPRDKTIHKLFEEQVEKAPHNVAMTFNSSSVTYRELNTKANQVARTLRRKGVKSGALVAIMAERSFEMLIGLFGILKAGCGYLPIDPEYPEDRISYLLEDSQTRVLLTLNKHKGAIKNHQKIETISLDDPSLYTGNDGNLEDVDSKSVAYVIYTSGSTGKPKGVMIEHHSLVNRIQWMQKQYAITPDDVILQKTPFTFDVSVWELFWWSITGAKVCILEPKGEKDPDLIIKAIEKSRVTTMHFVPSMLNVFLEYEESQKEKGDFTSLRQVFASGEALASPQVKRFMQLLGGKYGVKLVNLYGPTEATIDVSYYECREGNAEGSIPIGKPIDNVRLYITNKNNKQLQPIGVPGELCISGIGLARGYLNRPELTAEKFIDSPFAAGERVYKTGDLAQWSNNGDIEYLGRLDHQVKIRGFRIELGEIEAVLLEQPGIKEAVVMDKADANGGKSLYAYIVTEKKLGIPAIKKMLKKYLPEYMVPLRFVIIEKMPVTHNGKVDRKALAAISGEPAVRNEQVTPRSKLEYEMVEIWKQVLNTDRISIKDDFFEIGGDSLKALRVITRTKNKCKLKDLFNNPTIETLSAHILKHNVETALLDKITKVGEKAEISIICVPYGGGNSVVYYPFAKALAAISAEYEVYAVNFPGHDIGQENEHTKSVTELAKECVREIKNKIKTPIVLYGQCVGAAWAVEISRQLQEENMPVRAVYIGGMLPINEQIPHLSQLKKIDVYEKQTDREIHDFLRSLGGFNEDMDEEVLAFTMKNFRRDVNTCIEYFVHDNPRLMGNKKLDMPLYCLVGSNDSMTSGYQTRHREWHNYAREVELLVLKEAEHYFIKDQAEEVARIITSRI